MPQHHTPTPPPMDIQVGDVWLCGDGVTKRTIAAIEPNIVRYPVRCTCGACYTDDGRYWQLKGRSSSLDLIKLISRNGQSTNITREQDFQVDDVWQCRDGVTLVTITEYLPESAYSYPIIGIVQGEEEDDLWTKDGRYDLVNKDNDLDLVKLILRNGSPVNKLP